jgi:hypothetical protein
MDLGFCRPPESTCSGVTPQTAPARFRIRSKSHPFPPQGVARIKRFARIGHHLFDETAVAQDTPVAFDPLHPFSLDLSNVPPSA